MRRELARGPKAIWPALLIVLAVAVVGGWVRWLIASSEFLWLDELHTSWSVAGGFGEVYQRALSGNQTPLYFWMSWLIAEVLGETEFSIRLLSLIGGIGSIAAAAWLVLRWTGCTIAAVVTSILIALDVQFIYYATEARPYALIQFLGIVQVALFWRLIKSCDLSAESESDQVEDQVDLGKAVASGPAGGSLWIWLPLITALLFNIHITSAWLFYGEVFFVCILLVLGAAGLRRNLKRLLITLVVTAVLCVPALLQLGQLAGRRSNWSSVSSIPELLDQQAMPVGCWLLIPAAAMLIAVLSLGGGLNLAKQEYRDRNRGLGFVLLWALLPTVGVIALASFEIAPMAHVRYTLIGAVAMPIFAGLVIGFAEVRKIRLVLAIVLIATSLAWSPITSGKFVTSGFDVNALLGLRWEDWKSPINEINANQAKANHPVLLASNLIEDVDAFKNSDSEFQAYLRFPVGGLHRIENQSSSDTERETSVREIIAIPTLLSEHTRDSDIEKIKSSGGAWLIVRGTEDLAFEIEDEIVSKAAAQFPDAGPPKINRFAVPSSYVYLISFDW